VNTLKLLSCLLYGGEFYGMYLSKTNKKFNTNKAVNTKAERPVTITNQQKWKDLLGP
jgi:hypothetical protein